MDALCEQRRGAVSACTSARAFEQRASQRGEAVAPGAEKPGRIRVSGEGRASYWTAAVRKALEMTASWWSDHCRSTCGLCLAQKYQFRMGVEQK